MTTAIAQFFARPDFPNPSRQKMNRRYARTASVGRWLVQLIGSAPRQRDHVSSMGGTAILTATHPDGTEHKMRFTVDSWREADAEMDRLVAVLRASA